jgi:peptidoglycan/LPS O-acetylase OafA/YrhL
VVRRYELDWLRVLLFALLVPHHIAVGFVDWGVDIYRFVNDRLAGEGMTLFIYWSHSWRLPSLFLIAGIGTWFVTVREVGSGFMGRRLFRLLLPAIFGTLFLNVFGGYAIAVATGTATPFPAFWWTWLTDPVPRQVQHLWFLFNLAIYTLLLWPVFAVRDRIAARMIRPDLLLASLLLASAVAIIVLKPHAPALVGDNYQFAFYLIFFLGGFLLGAGGARVLDWCGQYAWWLLAVAVAVFFAKVALLSIALQEDIPTGEALARGGWVPLGLSPANATAFSAVEAATAWFWCCAALGLSVRFLAKPSPVLARLTRATFPFYVLHFPITLVGLAIAAEVSLPWAFEFAVLLVFVYGLTWLLWRAVERLGWVAPLFGGRMSVPPERAGIGSV